MDLITETARGPFAWVVIGETFPLRTRAKQASIATAANWLGNFMVGFLTPLANDGISYAFGYVFFVTNLFSALMMYLFLYETKYLALENVNAMYSDPSTNARKSRKWIPPGYTDRLTRDPAYFKSAGESAADKEYGRHGSVAMARQRSVDAGNVKQNGDGDTSWQEKM